MAVTIVTTAYLGDKKNLKTAGILPVINEFSQRNELDQVVCQVHKNFYFPRTVSCAPVWYRYLMRLLECVPGLSLTRARMFFTDYFASLQLQSSEVVILHPPGRFKKTIAKARQQGSIVVGIATVAHPKFDQKIFELEYERFGTSFRTPEVLGVLHKTMESLDYIIAYSDFVKRTYVERGFPAERIFVAYSDIPISDELPTKKEGQKFKVLFLAYSTPRKGLHYLLEAWDKLQLDDAELVIVGGYGSEAYTPKEFKQYCNSIIKQSSNIKWVEKVEYTAQYFNAASVFVFPSLSEGNPKVVMEAMSHGVPVITTENAKSIVEDGKTGYVVPVRDIAALKERIEFMYNHRDLASDMGVEAREALENKKSFGQSVYEIYQTVRELPQPATNSDIPTK